jgi:hypothetical protein
MLAHAGSRWLILAHAKPRNSEVCHLSHVNKEKQMPTLIEGKGGPIIYLIIARLLLRTPSQVIEIAVRVAQGGDCTSRG